MSMLSRPSNPTARPSPPGELLSAGGSFPRRRSSATSRTAPKGGRLMSQVDSVKEQLIRSDESFRNLYEEHLEYKRRLDQIRGKSLPSEQDEIEMKRIKLHKLALKDQMEVRLLAEAQAS
jgi:uncharacterized protein YdcH (DUF465 family)